jgi:preprotein translocase subunit SecF
MFRIIERRGWWFALSLIVILPGIIYMIWSGVTRGYLLPLSIDYTGGTLWEIRFAQSIEPGNVRQVFVDAGYPDTAVFTIGDDKTVQVKLKAIDGDQKSSLKADLDAKFGAYDELSYRSLGPTMGNEVSRAALLAVAVASGLILLYIAWAFRQVPHPFRYGICAVIALIHDVLVVISFVCIMNLIAGWEVDALTLTAVLTVIGFSVTDTVVVFDRIRENFKRYRGQSFDVIADRSLVETMVRSIGTQVTALLVLVSILVLGGPTLQAFVATLIVGFISGMYSSIFNASPLVAAWEDRALLPRKSASPATNGTPATA